MHSSESMPFTVTGAHYHYVARDDSKTHSNQFISIKKPLLGSNSLIARNFFRRPVLCFIEKQWGICSSLDSG